MRAALSIMLCVGCVGIGAAKVGAQEAVPEGPALTAAEFDALTRGKRMNTFDPDIIYGVEEFLPGQRSIWKGDYGCKQATWEQVGAQICFHYEDHPNEPICWIYKLHKGEIWGWYQGDASGAIVRLVPGNTPMNCTYLGA